MMRLPEFVGKSPIRSRNNKDDYIGDIWCLVPDDGPSSGSDQTLCSPWSPRPCAGADGDARSGVMVGAGASGLQAPDLCVVEASPSDRDGSEFSVDTLAKAMWVQQEYGDRFVCICLSLQICLKIIPKMVAK